MSIDFKKIVKPYEHQLIKSINYFCGINSVNDETSISENKPYGEGIDHCLKEFAKLGEMYGFDVERNPRFVELSLGKEGHLIEIFGHLDVVPVNTSDVIDHFKVIEKDGKLFARGVADDKGPLLAAFYAVKALKDNGLIKNSRIKIFAGGDEEKGSTCLEYYVNELKKETPKYGFTPDSSFPLIYGEKGSGSFDLNKQIKLNHIKSIKGGEAVNVVIQYCDFEVDNIDEIKDKLDKNKIEKINGNVITFKGKAAHGSMPQLGENAFLIGIKELSKFFDNKILEEIYENFIDYNGKTLGLFSTSKDLKDTVFNIGIVSYINNNLVISVNFRYPETITSKTISEGVSKKIGFDLSNVSSSEPLLIDPKSKLVSLLMSAYNIETKDNSGPVTSGGGTYAKEVKNTVAFGMEFPGKNYKMHEDDEYVNIDDLFTAMRIYAHAIYNLMNEDEN